jgi:hypothetical protein
LGLANPTVIRSHLLKEGHLNHEHGLYYIGGVSARGRSRRAMSRTIFKLSRGVLKIRDHLFSQSCENRARRIHPPRASESANMSPTNERDYERSTDGEALDETDVSLRAYFSRMSDEKLREYDPSWTDEQVIEWDGNFRSDGALMLVCCERDVEVHEYREVLHEHLQRRGIRR